MNAECDYYKACKGVVACSMCDHAECGRCKAKGKGKGVVACTICDENVCEGCGDGPGMECSMCDHAEYGRCENKGKGKGVVACSRCDHAECGRRYIRLVTNASKTNVSMEDS